MFNYNIPPITAIQGTQRAAVERPINDSESLLITGCPGSGKTTVINYRAKNVEGSHKKYIFLVWTKFLQRVIQNLSEMIGIPANKIGRVEQWYYRTFRNWLRDGDDINTHGVDRNFNSLGKYYDEILLDEAQDLWIEFIRRLPKITKQLTICCDNAQDVFGHIEVEGNLIAESIKENLENSGIIVNEFMLNSNYRNTKEIYEFSRQFVKEIPITKIDTFERESIGDKPKIFRQNDRADGFKTIKTIIDNAPGENIGVLCEFISDINSISNFFDQVSLEHTRFHSRLHWKAQREILESIERIVVCTQQAAKGLEFDTVIIPFIEKMGSDEIKRRRYYVACTRAKNKLRLVSMNSDISFVINHIQDNSLYQLI